MIRAVLSNPAHPEYGVVTIPFPIPHDQYAHCMRTRDELIQTADEIDAMMTCDCELRLLGECLPREELVFLLEQDKPLEQMSKAWMEHRNVDIGETFQSLLTGLYAEQQHDMGMKM